MKHKVLCTAPFKRFPKVMDHFHKVFDGKVVEYMVHSQLAEDIRAFEGLIPNARILVDEEVFRNARNLKAIYQPSIGYEHIDLSFAKSKSILFNGLGLDTKFKETLWSTAEHTLSMILALLKSSVKSTQDVKSNGSWDNRKYFIRDLRGLEVGIIGLGNIGSKVAHLCNAFGAKLYAYDPYLAEHKFPSYVDKVSLDSIMSQSDIVTAHVPLNGETQKMICENAISKMKKGSFLLNVARGGIVCETSLLKALEADEIAGAALDVLDGESPFGVGHHPLVQFSKDRDNVLITPHLGGSSYPYMESIFIHSIDELKVMLDRCKS